MSIRAAAAWLLAAALLPAVRAEVAVPPLAARVTDQTATLSTAQKQTLEQRLAAFEAQKGSQIAVLIVPTTQPEAIEQYSIRVAEQWKIGRKGIDDGAILLIARNDRKMRIEVGYGLEGALPDITCKRIISEIITPYFKTGDFYGGISAGVDKMIGVINGEPLPPPAMPGSNNSISNWPYLFPIVPFLFFFLIWCFMLSKGARLSYSTGGSSSSGGFSSGGGFSGGGFSGGGGSFGGGGASGSW